MKFKSLGNLLIAISLLSLITACGEGRGKKTRITKPSKSTGVTKFSLNNTLIEQKDAKGKVTGLKCINISKVINDINNFKNVSFRAYIADHRVLDKVGMNPSNIDPLTQPQYIQENSLLDQIQGNKLPFYETGYAKDIKEEVPSNLVPFSIESDQKDCENVDVTIQEHGQQKGSTVTLKVKKSDLPEQELILSKDGEYLFIFRIPAKNKQRLEFVTYRQIFEKPECKSNDRVNYTTSTTYIYEWGYEKDQKIDVVSNMLETLKSILNQKIKGADARGIPQDVEKELQAQPPSATKNTRIAINVDDYLTMTGDLEGDRYTAKCRK